MSIKDWTERELVERVLEIYSPDTKATKAIAAHIAIKLQERRTLIRERRKKGGKPLPYIEPGYSFYDTTGGQGDALFS